ncbi:MAG: heme lyase CcmF/NrfE family subunit [Terriglobia bacterium]
MELIGSFALLLALCLCAYAVVAALLAARSARPLLLQSAERATLVVNALIVVATGCLVALLLTDQFYVGYVQQHSNRALPLYYKFAALWGGQDGSLLWWSCLLSTYAMLAVWLNRRAHRHLMPYVIAVVMGVQLFFLLLNNFAANPFQLLAFAEGGRLQVFAPPDGGGLNPLLQHPAMTIHPPMLYLGYVGFTIPFAFALAALITRSKGEQWIYVTRRWTMVSWGFLSVGVLLGARWAYAVLGWGGYWGWDPVENASLLPWLTGTAFLHSVMMQEKRGMLKLWNMGLIFATFFLCIFGTFLTRSGVLSSVHAFAESPIGPYFATFIVIGLVVTGAILLARLDFLKSENQLDSLVSRESSFLFNNLILLASCFAVLWGTLFPLISEAARGVKITVGAPYFNKVNVPIALFLLFLTGVGPLLAWRRTSLESLHRNFTRPLLVGASVAVVAFVFGAGKFYPLMAVFLGVFVAATIAMEFYRGARVLRQKSRLGWVGAAVALTRRNTRRYGGYIIHFGIAVLFIGIAGSAFSVEQQAEMQVGSETEAGGYRFVCRNLIPSEAENHVSVVAEIAVYREGELITTMYPERRTYKVSQQRTTLVAIEPRLMEDVYVVFAGMSEDGQRAVMQIYINPLVNWVWLGGFIVVLGTLIALMPNAGPEQFRPQRRLREAAEVGKERDAVPV